MQELDKFLDDVIGIKFAIEMAYAELKDASGKEASDLSLEIKEMEGTLKIIEDILTEKEITRILEQQIGRGK